LDSGPRGDLIQYINKNRPKNLMILSLYASIHFQRPAEEEFKVLLQPPSPLNAFSVNCLAGFTD